MNLFYGLCLSVKSPLEEAKFCEPLYHSLFFLDCLQNLFINSVSASLIGGPSFDNRRDTTRVQLVQQVDVVIQHDPEFLLKVSRDFSLNF